MAIRLLTVYKSHEAPGPDGDKNMEIANRACQKRWSRNFDPTLGDRWTCEGGYDFYNERCYVLVDNGPVDAADQEVVMYKWKGQELVEESPVPNIILAKLQKKYHFDPEKRPVPRQYSNDEYRKEFGEEAFRALQAGIQEKKDLAKRFGCGAGG